MEESTVHLPGGASRFGGGYQDTAMLVRNEAKFDTHTGPVKTQHDMTPKEIAALEKHYGAKINMDVVVDTHGTMDDASICNGWYHAQHRRRQLAKEALESNGENRQDQIS